MKVLLIGKFPPVQGGIATKTYWLYRALAALGIKFDVITTIPTTYHHADTGFMLPEIRCHVPDENTKAPWFIPGGSLTVERIISTALKVASETHPDIIETNYLIPYATAAYIVAKILRLPFILRHADSDIIKLLGFAPAATGISAILADAECVVTSMEHYALLNKIVPAQKLVPLPRYIPDPSAFTLQNTSPLEPCLLVAGKLNFYWRIKALDNLLASLAKYPLCNLCVYADGIGLKDFDKEVVRLGVQERIQYKPFHPPDAMPGILGDVSVVWAVERENFISSFSNLVWESLAVGRPCLVSHATAKNADARIQLWEGLITLDPNEVSSIFEAIERAINLSLITTPDWLEEEFSSYVKANATLYRKIAGC